MYVILYSAGDIQYSNIHTKTIDRLHKHVCFWQIWSNQDTPVVKSLLSYLLLYHRLRGRHSLILITVAGNENVRKQLQH